MIDWLNEYWMNEAMNDNEAMDSNELMESIGWMNEWINEWMNHEV